MSDYDLSPEEVQAVLAKAKLEREVEAKKREQAQAQAANFIPRNIELYAHFGEKAPLMSTMGESTSFPTEALDGILLNACDGIKDSSPTCPPEIIYQSVLASATTAVSGYANILMNGDRITSLNDFFVTIGDSSAGKSSAMSKAMEPIAHYANGLHQEYKEWVKDKMFFDETKEKRSMRYDVPPPCTGLLIQNDFTIEALTVSLINQPLVMIANSDAGSLLENYSFKSGKFATISTLSLLWDGAEVVRNRVKDQGIVYKMPNRRVSMHLMFPEKVARALLFKQDSEEQGFLSRILMASPSAVPKYDFMNDLDKDFDAVNASMNDYKENMGLLLRDINYSPDLQLSPRVITVSRDATALYLSYRNKCVDLAAGEYNSICQTVNKLPQHLLKLAALIQLVNHPASLEVSPESIEKGLLLCDYYLGEAARLLGVGRGAKDFTDAQTLWDWLDSNRQLCDKKTGTILQSIITRGCPKKFRQTSTVKKLCLQLFQHGYMRPKSNVNDRGVRWEIAS